MKCHRGFQLTIAFTIAISFQSSHWSVAQVLRGVPDDPVRHVEFGSTFSVACSPETTDETSEINWYGPNSYFPSSNEPNLIKSRLEMPRQENADYSRVYSQKIGNSVTLYVMSVEAVDTGVYNCTGRVNNIPSKWSFELQSYEGLTVQADAEQILIFGENRKIGCQVHSSPPPETQWFFEAQHVITEGSLKYEKRGDGLVVYNVTWDDAGNYECVGRETVRGTTDIKAIRVEVVTRPVMTNPPVNTTGVRFRDASILCSATSIPPPEYKWYLGSSSNVGDEVTSHATGDRFRPSTANGDLSIVDVHLDDENWYWCEASNRAGYIRRHVFFEVQMIPVFSDSVNVNKTETLEGNTVEMICQCESKPNPKMYFKREGNREAYSDGYQDEDSRIFIYEKPSSERSENELITPQEVVIRIENTTPNDTANYTCIAENSAGRNQTTMHIIIQHIPNFELMPSNLYTQCIWEEHPRNITAFLSGYPHPSVSWAGPDGRHISPDEDAFRTYLEPYWENGRRDEWMANLEINWEVTKGGIQGAYNPTGNYFPTATNNHGSADITIRVVQANLPGRARNVNTTSITAQSITIQADPPVEDNCIQANAIEILYKPYQTNDFEQSKLFSLEERHKMVISDLRPGTSYSVLVYARNERGRSADPNSHVVDTLASTPPEVVNVTSEQIAKSATGHLVVWAVPLDGGERITHYIISWRKAGETTWITREVTTGSPWFSIPDLEPSTMYELKVQARNKKGLSAAPEQLDTFSTPSSNPDDTNPTAGSSVHGLPLEIHYIVVIAVIALLILMVAVDMICYCSRDWGLLACICGNVGQQEKDYQGDVLSLGGVEDRSLTDEIDTDEKSSTWKPSVSNTNSSYGGTATHGQDNRVCHKYDDSQQQRSMGPGDALTTFSSTDQEKSQPHEYINTARLNKGSPRAVPQQRTNYQPSSRPVPQPRVPSRVMTLSNNAPNSEPDNGYPAPNYDRYGQMRTPNPNPSTNATSAYVRPYATRYHHEFQPQNAARAPYVDNGDIDYHEQLRSSPEPPGHRPTLI